MSGIWRNVGTRDVAAGVTSSKGRDVKQSFDIVTALHAVGRERPHGVAGVDVEREVGGHPRSLRIVGGECRVAEIKDKSIDIRDT